MCVGGFVFLRQQGPPWETLWCKYYPGAFCGSSVTRHTRSHTGETRQHGACGSAGRWVTLPWPLSVRLAEKPCRWERRGEAFGKCTRPVTRRGLSHAEDSRWGDPADGTPRKDLLTRRTVFRGVREGLPQSSSAGVVAGGGLSRSSLRHLKGYWDWDSVRDRVLPLKVGAGPWLLTESLSGH